MLRATHKKGFAIQSSMKQPTNQQERNEDKKKPAPSHGIDPESKEPEMEVDQVPGERQLKKDDPQAA